MSEVFFKCFEMSLVLCRVDLCEPMNQCPWFYLISDQFYKCVDIFNDTFM